MRNAERHGVFADGLAVTEPALEPIAIALRRLIVELNPRACEIVWPRQHIASFGIGPSKKNEHYAYIAVHPKHVNLGFYQGAALDDAAGLLEGSGKQLRHIKIRTVEQIASPALRSLLIAAQRRRHSRAGDS